jgi:flagellar protein FliS
MNHFSSVQAYQNTGMITRVSEASPHQLILQLFEGAIQSVRFAKACIQRNDKVRKAQALSKAGAIVSELQKSLDLERGGELAVRLEILYDFMVRTIFEANLNDDVIKLDDVVQTLSDLSAAWSQIKPN